MKFIAITTAVVLAAQGCSFVFVNGPPARSPAAQESPEQLRCTRSRLSPIVDGVFGVVLLHAAAGKLLESGPDPSTSWQVPRQPPEPARPSISEVSTLMVLAAAAFAGTTYGFTRVAECKTAHERIAAQRHQTWVPIEQREIHGQ